jgi:hypothetical protein
MGHRTVVGQLGEDRAVPVEDALCGATQVDDRAEFTGEAGDAEGALAVVFVQVELAALGAGVSGGSFRGRWTAGPIPGWTAGPTMSRWPS